MRLRFFDRCVWRYISNGSLAVIHRERPQWDIQYLKKSSYKRFRQIVENLSDVGNYTYNPMRMNLMASITWFSIYEIAAVMFGAPREGLDFEGGMDYPLYEKMCLESMERPLMKAMFSRSNMLDQKAQDRYIRKTEKVNTVDCHYNWHYRKIAKGDPPEDEFISTVDKCGICTLARKLGHMDLLRPICRMEETTADAMGVNMYLERCLERGDEECTIHYTRPGSAADSKMKEKKKERESRG